MANGYLLIKKTDIYEDDGVIYWKNGANIIGNVVKCVDSDEAEHYYIESLKTRKAILLEDGVKIGGGDFGFESTNGNFILVTTDEVDFSDIGGGNGVSITFTFGSKYYTVTLPEDNGDLKIYDPDGEGGEIGGGSTKYIHTIRAYKIDTLECVFQIINDNNTQMTLFADVKNALYSMNTRVLASGCGHYGGTIIFDSVSCTDNINITFSGTELEILNNNLKETYNMGITFSSGVSFTDQIIEL